MAPRPSSHVPIMWLVIVLFVAGCGSVVVQDGSTGGAGGASSSSGMAEGGGGASSSAVSSSSASNYGCPGGCAANQICLHGECVCAPTLTMCGGACVDLSFDDQHCSDCNNSCGNGHCVLGACQCPPGMSDCGVGKNCVDFSSAHDDCGVCHHACGPTSECVNGTCE